jgi:hypothetical protein
MSSAPRASLTSLPRAVARLWRFDLQRFRVPIAVVVGLELLRAALAEWVLHGGPLLSSRALDNASVAFEFQALDGALCLATAIATAIVIQADHPADDRGFLRSRPVGPLTVAMTKLTQLAGLFVVLPFVVTAIRLSAYGAPAASVAAGAVQFVVIGGAVVLPAWALALVTRTLPRFLAAGAGLVILWYVAVAAVVSSGLNQWFDPRLIRRIYNQPFTTFAPPLADWQYANTHGWWVALAVTTLAAAIVVTYYRTRHAIGSALAGIALVVGPALVPVWTPTSPAPRELAAGVDGHLRLAALVVPRTTNKARLSYVGERWVLVMGTVALPPLPPNVSVERNLGPVRITAPGVELKADGLPLYGRPPILAAMAAAGGTVPDWPQGRGDDHLFSATRESVDALRARHVDVEAPVDLRFTRHVLVAMLALRAGQSFRTPEYLFEIVAIAPEQGALCRFTRFPSLKRTATAVTPFVPARRVPPIGTIPGMSRPAVIPSLEGRIRAFDGGPYVDPDDPIWAFGRSWTRQLWLPIGDAAAPAVVRIVESRRVGDLRTRLVAHDVPVEEPAESGAPRLIITPAAPDFPGRRY